MSQRKLIALVLSLIIVFTAMAPIASAYEGNDRIYTVATAHLDTIWQWTYETTVNSYIPKTFNENDSIFKNATSQNYSFTFEGAWRYMLWEEYYPEQLEAIKQYVAAGKWTVSGSGIENGDVNVPSPESLIRNMLYGNNYFDEQFGKKSVDIYLPDCFGFGYALPSIARHTDLIGFGTQKLQWGYYNTETGRLNQSPFDLGKWYGVDGNFIYASLRYGGYTNKFQSGNLGADPRTSTANQGYGDGSVVQKLSENKAFGLNWTARLHGTGDTGGSPGQTSATNVSNAVGLNGTAEANGIDVLSVSSDQVYRDMDALLSNTQKDALPTVNKELTLRDHGVGGYTSRAQGKRWNRQYELMGDVAERASSAAMWLGLDYNQEVINKAWIHGISQQFHDTIPGTSWQREYRRVWNDYAVSIFRFGQEYENAVSGVARALNTNVTGVPVVVNNPIETDRTDAVEASVTMPAGTESVRVYTAAGVEAPSQIVSKDGNTFKIVFLATVPSMGYTVYDVQATAAPSAIENDLTVTENMLENAKYKVTLDSNGDIVSIIDKANAGKELLASPIRMALNAYKGSSSWPAWELTYSETVAKPHTFASDPTFEIVEDGPARITIKTTRTAVGSTFEQYISLSEGGQRVDINNIIDWHSGERLLHTPFALTVSNPKASYDLGLGVVERNNSFVNDYEFPAQRWADVTDADGSYGVSVLSDAKYGWHKTNDNTIALTGIHSPSQTGSYRDSNNMQHLLEMGYNEYGFSVYGHANGYQNGTQQQADAFNQPLYAFQTTKHAGTLGSNYSFGSVSTPQAVIRAVKKAEYSNEIIVRVNEMYGESATGVKLSLGNGILSAREVSGAETTTDYEYNSTGDNGPISVNADGELVFDLTKYQIRSFAIQLKEAPVQLSAYDSMAIDLDYNIDVFSSDANRADGAIPNTVYSFPAELTPATVTTGGVDFKMGSKADGENNAMYSLGQRIEVPAGYNTLYVLANTTSNDVTADFEVGGQKTSFTVHKYNERVGAGDLPDLSEYGYVKDVNVGMYYTHMHRSTANATAVHTYMFKYAIDIPEGGATVKLPVNSNIIFYAATAVNETEKTSAVTPLHDEREKTDFEGFDRYIVPESYIRPEIEGLPAIDPDSPKLELDFDNNYTIPSNNIPQGGDNNVTGGSAVVTTEEAHSGTSSIKFTGTKSNASGSGAYAYRTIWSVSGDAGIKITNGNYYLGWWQKRPTGTTASRYTTVELYNTSGTGNTNDGTGWPRDNSSLIDQYGYRMHASNRGPIRSDGWEYYEINLKPMVGQTVYRIVVSLDTSTPASNNTFTSYYDDIFIGEKEPYPEYVPDAPAASSVVQVGPSISSDPQQERFYDFESATPALTNTSVTSGSVSGVSITRQNVGSEAYSGSYVARLTGNNTSSTSGNAYHRAFGAGLNIPITNKNTVIGFWMKPMTELGRYVSLDIYFTSGYMRDSATVDQYGVQTHPKYGRGKVGEWSYYEFNLGETQLGKTIDTICIAFDKDNVATTGTFTTYVDDIRVFVREEGVEYDLLGRLPQQVEDAYQLSAWSDVTHADMTSAVEDMKAAAEASELTAEGYAAVFGALQDAVWNLDERYIGFFDVEVVNQKTNYTVNEDLIQVRVRATPEIQKIALYNENGSKIGTPYQSINYGTDDKGNTILVWDLWFTMGSIGQRTISVRGGVNSYEETDLSASVKMIAKAAGSITLNSATGPRTAVAGQNFEVTVKTGKGVQKVGFYNEKDAAIGKTLVSCTVTGEDELTWVYSMNIGTKGIRAVTVKAAGPDGAWITATKTLAIIVNDPPPAA